MGFSISSTHMVFFVASMVVASIVAGVFINSTFSIRDGIVDKEGAITDRLKTDIEIINDPQNIPNNPVKIYVKNTGTTDLNKSTVNILINGSLISSPSIDIVDGVGYVLEPTEVMVIMADIKLPNGDHLVKVVGDNMVYDEIEFSI